MKITHIFFGTLIGAFLLFAAGSFAQTPVPVAQVNILGAKVEQQVGNVLNISFTLSNGAGMQTGVQYSIRLLSKANSRVIVDEAVYEEKLTLAQNSTIRKSVAYNAPATLWGTYTLQVVSSNSAGFPFGFSTIGDVTLTASQKGVTIAPESCTLASSDGKTYKNTESPVLAGNQTLRLSCVATNTAPGSMTVTPKFVTYNKTLYGSTVEHAGGSSAPITFAANEKKTVSLDLPKAIAPGAYKLAVTLGTDAQQSNKVIVGYGIEGAAASILNISTDKDYYARKDTAQVMVLWNNTGTAATSLRVRVGTEGIGFACGERTIDAPKSGTQIVPVSISRSCFNPQISVTVKDEKGTVIAEAAITIPTTSIEKPENTFGGRGVLIALGMVALLVLIGIAAKRKKNGGDVPGAPSALALILAVMLGLSLFSSTAHADTYDIGGAGDLFLITNISNNTNIGSGTYSQGNQMKVEALLQNDAFLGTQTMTLSAITIGNNTATFFPSEVTIPPSSSIQADDKLFTVNTPGAGTYTVDFTAGLKKIVGGGVYQGQNFDCGFGISAYPPGWNPAYPSGSSGYSCEYLPGYNFYVAFSLAGDLQQDVDAVAFWTGSNGVSYSQSVQFEYNPSSPFYTLALGYQGGPSSGNANNPLSTTNYFQTYPTPFACIKVLNNPSIEVPSALQCPSGSSYAVCDDTSANNYGQAGSCIYDWMLCQDPNASNYGALLPCEYNNPVQCNTWDGSLCNFNAIGCSPDPMNPGYEVCEY